MKWGHLISPPTNIVSPSQIIRYQNNQIPRRSDPTVYKARSYGTLKVIN